MDIQYIQQLLLNSFKDYKELLLNNQKQIIKKQQEECVFISVLDVWILEEKLEQVSTRSFEQYPLLGVPFAVKDNIDVFGMDTTAGCKSYAYSPQKSAFVVQLLEKAGAICIGKTNMDQFATGLVGTRSFYGIAKNFYNPNYIPGGSSSGSASAVSAKYVPFSLGTDTAGSGRIPAAFQNLIGFKPSKGLFSSRGVVPACKSLDCVSVFANSLQDIEMVYEILSIYDKKDPYSRSFIPLCASNKLKIAVPLNKNLEFFGNKYYEKEYENFINSLLEKDYQLEEIDFSPMLNAAKLLYEGPWLAERYHAVGEFINDNPEAIIESTKQVITKGKDIKATSYFEAAYQLQLLKKQFQKLADKYTVFLTPTAGTIYTPRAGKKHPFKVKFKFGLLH